MALLEVKLSADGRLKLLERSEIDKIVKEQELQLLFAPEAGTKRSALGQLLKADLLILLRAGEKKGDGRYLDVIVCETKAGLRLRVTRMPWTDEQWARLQQEEEEQEEQQEEAEQKDASTQPERPADASDGGDDSRGQHHGSEQEASS